MFPCAAIQRGAPHAAADQRRAEGGERAVAGCAGGHESGAQGDEGRSGQTQRLFSSFMTYPLG